MNALRLLPMKRLDLEKAFSVFKVSTPWLNVVHPEGENAEIEVAPMATAKVDDRNNIVNLRSVI